jgi:hypothetical protein
MQGFWTTITVKGIVELVAIAMLPIGFLGFMLHRIVAGKPIGGRSIQFLGVVFLVPVILILALEKILDGATIGTLIGAVVGYLLSGIANYEPPQRRDNNNAPRP